MHLSNYYVMWRLEIAINANTPGLMALQRMQCKLFPMEIPSRIHLLIYWCRVLGKYGMVGLQPETMQFVVKCFTTQTSMI